MSLRSDNKLVLFLHLFCDKKNGIYSFLLSLCLFFCCSGRQTSQLTPE